MRNIIKPKEFTINRKARYQDFMRYNFIDVHERLYKKCWLYKRIIYLEMEVNLQERSLFIQVKNNNTGGYYTPFYNPTERYNNSLYDEVVATYNRIMTNYVKRNINIIPIKHIGEVRMIKIILLVIIVIFVISLLFMQGVSYLKTDEEKEYDDEKQMEFLKNWREKHQKEETDGGQDQS